MGRYDVKGRVVFYDSVDLVNVTRIHERASTGRVGAINRPPAFTDMFKKFEPGS